MSNRLREFTRKLDDLGVDAMLVTDEINVGYLTGFTGDSSFLWVESNSATLLSDRRYETQIASECPDLQVAIRAPSKSMLDLVVDVVHGATAETVGVESADLSVETWLAMTRAVPDLKFVPTVGQVESLRVIKDAEEIVRTRRAVSIAERAFQSVLPRLTPQWSEREVAFELEAVMRQLGASGVSFDPIVGAEPFGALPHYRPGANRIDDAATLLIDWGAKYCGYASDLTRTLHRSHASDAFRRAYDAVLAAQLAAIDMIAPGATASTVDAAARDCLVDAGYGDAFKHGLGHGTGLEIHEAPRLSSMSDEVLRPGMIITVEPGVYFEGDFGIRIEDDVLVTESGHEVLSTLPKGLEDSRLMM